jgi:hypothetical protein
MTECDDKSRELSRIKASSLFGDGHDSLAALESALGVKVLEATLKDMVSNGVNHDPLKGKGIMVRIKSEPSSPPPNRARSSSSGSGYSSASSATSLPSFIISSSNVSSPLIGIELKIFCPRNQSHINGTEFFVQNRGR